MYFFLINILVLEIYNCYEIYRIKSYVATLGPLPLQHITFYYTHMHFIRRNALVSVKTI